ncbi:hypothetical protein DSO57_1008711 [Entomophthora muscae]|uniref:Uncharacterized protein n=1 Tax=Entomophthora muscae TaxID=34485 RepID=A0ACC2SVV5_9FUNG|nr:hypothetical protein DSO57_1008711 [Entomophthora muscae]
MSDSDNYDEFKEDDHFKSPSNESNFHLEEETPAHERPISSNNFGYKLLQKMGWKEGLGLGSSGQGRSEPIPLTIQEDKGGVGKNEELNLYHSLSTAERKLLETEVIAAETEEQRLARKEKNEKKLEVQKEISNALSVFYCALCDKQYSKSSDYETHLDSYDHHHKKRFKEMAESNRKLFSKKSKKIATEDSLKALSAEQGISLISSESATTTVSSGWSTVPEASWTSIEPSKPEHNSNTSDSIQTNSALPKLTFTNKEKTLGSKVIIFISL